MDLPFHAGKDPGKLAFVILKQGRSPMMRSYMVVYERVAEDNWGGWAPDVGGAVGAGDSLSLARVSLSEGIAMQLEDLAQRGIEAPPARSTGIDFSEFDPDPSKSHYEVEWMCVALPPLHASHQEQQAA